MAYDQVLDNAGMRTATATDPDGIRDNPTGDCEICGRGSECEDAARKLAKLERDFASLVELDKARRVENAALEAKVATLGFDNETLEAQNTELNAENETFARALTRAPIPQDGSSEFGETEKFQNASWNAEPLLEKMRASQASEAKVAALKAENAKLTDRVWRDANTNDNLVQSGVLLGAQVVASEKKVAALAGLPWLAFNAAWHNKGIDIMSDWMESGFSARLRAILKFESESREGEG